MPHRSLCLTGKRGPDQTQRSWNSQKSPWPHPILCHLHEGLCMQGTPELSLTQETHSHHLVNTEGCSPARSTEVPAVLPRTARAPTGTGPGPGSGRQGTRKRCAEKPWTLALQGNTGLDLGVCLFPGCTHPYHSPDHATSPMSRHQELEGDQQHWLCHRCSEPCSGRPPPSPGPLPVPGGVGCVCGGFELCPGSGRGSRAGAGGPEQGGGPGERGVGQSQRAWGPGHSPHPHHPLHRRPL